MEEMSPNFNNPEIEPGLGAQRTRQMQERQREERLSRREEVFEPEISKFEVRWEHWQTAEYKTDSSDDAASLTNSANNTNDMDSIIYHGNYASDTGDNWELKVLEDFNGPIGGINFDIV